MTKIDIFSGFLGAGKTTLIKKLIQEAYQGEKLVLIENEFGEIGIDGGFLQDAGVEITEMNSGCICCSLVGDLVRRWNRFCSNFTRTGFSLSPLAWASCPMSLEPSSAWITTRLYSTLSSLSPMPQSAKFI